MKMILIRKCLNFFTKKHKNWIYAIPHINSLQDGASIENFSCDNIFSFINWLSKNSKVKLKIFIEQRDIRTPLVFGDLNIVFVQKSKSYFQFLKNSLIRYKCRQWWTCSSGSHFEDGIKKNKIVNFNYFTSLKNDYCRKTSSINKKFTHIFVSSPLDARISYSNFGGLLENYFVTGFPRNDYLFSKFNSNKINQWFSENGINTKNEKIVVYAPTVNEENSMYNYNLFGFDDFSELDNFLIQNKIKIIYKPHPLERYSSIKQMANVIEWKQNQFLTIYDILPNSNCLITNFSSIYFDYLLLNKPVFYLNFGSEKYSKIRGLTYEPFDLFCPNHLINNWDDLKKSLLSLNNEYSATNHNLIKHFFDKFSDGKSCERIYKILFENIEDEFRAILNWDPK